MSNIGDNRPPDMAATAVDVAKSISAWMAENPVIQTEDSARDAKVWLDRGKLCVKDLEDERDGKVRPLNEQVQGINAYYRHPREALQKILTEISQRISRYIREEERKRVAAAAEARRIAEEAERRAREAEAAEQEALRSASAGELGLDIASHVVAADDAFHEAQVKARQAALAERESHVKIGGGLSRAVSLKQKETLIVVDAVKAIKALGLTEDIKEAILRSARAYRKLKGKLPNGVESEMREEI